MCKQEKLYEDTASADGEVGTACERFEILLNDQLDLRNCLDGLSQDEHVVTCACCRSLLLKYQQLSGLIMPASKLKSVDLDRASEAGVKTTYVGRDARLGSGVAANRLVGWSTVLAILFLIWGTPAREFDVSASHSSTTSTVALTHGGTQLEIPGRDLLAGQLAGVSVSTVNFSDFSSFEKFGLGQYWQHASHLPGIEPWQHSVSFAIGWINQGEPRGVPSPLLDCPDADNFNSEMDSLDLSDNVAARLPYVA